MYDSFLDNFMKQLVDGRARAVIITEGRLKSLPVGDQLDKFLNSKQAIFVGTYNAHTRRQQIIEDIEFNG